MQTRPKPARSRSPPPAASSTRRSGASSAVRVRSRSPFSVPSAAGSSMSVCCVIGMAIPETIPTRTSPIQKIGQMSDIGTPPLREESASADVRQRVARRVSRCRRRPPTELHRVTCGRGRARDELAPVRPVEISCVASGLVANRCIASAAGSARPKPSVDACHSSRIGVPRTSIRTSARRRTSVNAVCASVSTSPSPATAAATAAAWLL